MAKIRVAILMGSDSDLPVVKEGLVILEQFHVTFDVQMLSAHRTPEDTVAYVKKMVSQGVDIFIAAAGGAAHLPGVIAAYTTKPVIGIPIQTKTLQGIDSLYSIVQMPPGVPVATVGINGAQNAGLLVVQILAVGDEALTKKLIHYKHELAAKVLEKTKMLTQLGYEKYLKEREK